MKRLFLVFALLWSIAASGGQSEVLTQVFSGRRLCEQFPGETVGAKIAACIADLPPAGGTADARGIQGTPVWSTDPFRGVTKPVNLILPSGTVAVAADTIVGTSINISSGQGSILSVNSGKTLTILGTLNDSTMSRHFAGSGTVVINGASPITELYPEWWGAVHDNVTDVSAAMQATLTAAAHTGKAVFLNSGLPYYMGTTGLQLKGTVRFYSNSIAGLLWSGSFAGTGITVGADHAGYNTIENIALFMPKSAGVPNSATVCIDVVAPLNRLINVRCDQSSVGNHSPWYTGVKIGDISNSISYPHIYSYDTGIVTYSAPGGSGSRNDLTIMDGEVTSEVTASIDLPQTGSVTIRDVDIETLGRYAIRMTSTTAEIAGGLIAGNYIQGATSACVYIAAAARFPARGVTIVGNEINCGTATSAIDAANTVGLTINGGYLVGGTNYAKLNESNTAYLINPGYTSGLFSGSGTLQPVVLPLSGVAFPDTSRASADGNTLDDYKAGTWIPAVGGTATYTLQRGAYVKIGRQVTINGSLVINALGTGSPTTISGLPFPAKSTYSFSGAVHNFSRLAVKLVWIAASIDGSVITFNTMPAAGSTVRTAAPIFGNGARVDFTAMYFTD